MQKYSFKQILKSRKRHSILIRVAVLHSVGCSIFCGVYDAVRMEGRLAGCDVRTYMPTCSKKPETSRACLSNAAVLSSCFAPR